MSPAEVLAFEARWRTRAAIGSAVGALLVLGGGIGLVTTLCLSGGILFELPAVLGVAGAK